MKVEPDDRPKKPEVRVEHAKGFDGYVVLEGEKIVAIALSAEDAKALLDKLRTDVDLPDDT